MQTLMSNIKKHIKSVTFFAHLSDVLKTAISVKLPLILVS